MTDEKRCGLSSFLPMSCRGRAEAFARRLHSRLRSLGSQDGDHTSESSWLTANEIPPTVVTSLQPRHDAFMDFAMFDATGSPEEAELTEPELSKFITNPQDDLHPSLDECDCVAGKRNSLDSDSSDGVYYDPENDADRFMNNHRNGRLHQSDNKRNTSDAAENSDNTLYCLTRHVSKPAVAESTCSNYKSEINGDSEASLSPDKFQSLSSLNISDPIATESRNISDEHAECIRASNPNPGHNGDTILKSDIDFSPDRAFRSLSEEPVVLSLEYECTTSRDITLDEASISSDNILLNMLKEYLPSSKNHNHDSGISQDTNLDQASSPSQSTLSPKLSEELLTPSSESINSNNECIGISNQENGINHEPVSPVVSSDLTSYDSDSTLSQNTSEDITTEYTSSSASNSDPDKITNIVSSENTVSRHIIEEPTTLSLDYSSNHESSAGDDTISNQAKFPSDTTLSSLSQYPSEEPIVPSLDSSNHDSSTRDLMPNFPSFPSQSTLSGLSRNISEDPIFQSSDITVSSISRSEDEVPPSQSSECMSSCPSEYGTPLASLSDFITEPPKIGWTLKYDAKVPHNNNVFSAIDLESLKSCNNPEETYCSQLNIQQNLTFECPNPIVEISSLEIQDKEEIKLCNVESKVEDKLHLQVLDDEIYDLEERMPRIRRCSSLKTGKTPPGTPGRKKIVRFADVLGLDLADVRTFMDEIPKIPTSAYDDLSDLDLSLPDPSNAPMYPAKTLVALFEQPGGEANFLDKVAERQVCLENAVLQDPVTLCICGIIRVRNLDFNKSVHLRYTTDAWKNFADLQAKYIENSCDGFSDKFSFTLYVHTLTVGQRLEFAVRFQCHGIQYWDNNAGANYCFQCLPTKTNLYLPLNGPDDNNWAGAAFYYDNTISLRTNVQEIVTQNLVVKTHTQMSGEMLTALIILLFACLLIFIQKISYLLFAS